MGACSAHVFSGFSLLNFKELELDWNFFERIRTIRNKNKYLGYDITKEKWLKIELQTDLYISTIKRAIEKEINLK